MRNRLYLADLQRVANSKPSPKEVSFGPKPTYESKLIQLASAHHPNVDASQKCIPMHAIFKNYKKHILMKKSRKLKCIGGIYSADYTAEKIILGIEGIQLNTKFIILERLRCIDTTMQIKIANSLKEYSKGLSHTISSVKHINRLLEECYEMIDFDKFVNTLNIIKYA